MAVDFAYNPLEPRDADGHWVKTGMSYDEADQHLEDWFHPQQLESPKVPHPASGYLVKVGVERRLRHPEGQGELPAVFGVKRYNETAKGLAGMMPEDLGTEPVRHVYRAVSTEDWERMKKAGSLSSDQRGTIASWEGMNAAVDPKNAMSYLPLGGEGRIMKIAVRPEDRWFTVSTDSYARTREPVPLSQVEAVSPVIAKDRKTYLSLPHGSAAIYPNGKPAVDMSAAPLDCPEMIA